MANRLASFAARPWALRTLFNELRLAARLLREPRVPAFLKALPAVALLYLVSPFDVLPDVLPVLGQLDDIGLIILTVKAFLKLCPSGVASFHQAAIAAGRRYAPMEPGDVVIDAPFRRD